MNLSQKESHATCRKTHQWVKDVLVHWEPANFTLFNKKLQGLKQGCGAGTGRNRIHLGTSAPEPYSKWYGSGSGYKEMKQTTQKI
jgi:hypothetical protein